MSRSVDYLTNATAVAYLYIYDDEQWDDFKSDVAETLQTMFPSLRDCDRWDNNETHIFLENNLAEVGISEYNGIVSVSIRPTGDYYDNTEALAVHWCETVVDTFKTIGTLIKQGTFSNGEAVYALRKNET
jgi:hypothetical protein